MKKIIFILLCFSIFGRDNTENPPTWKKGFAPSIVLGFGRANGDFASKADFRAQILKYNNKKKGLQSQGLAFGLGSAYISDQGFSTYLESTYGKYGFNQFNGRVRLGLTGKGDTFTGISLTKSFTFLITDTSFDYIMKEGKDEKVLTFGMGFGF